LRHLLCHFYASRLGGFGKQKNAKNEWEKRGLVILVRLDHAIATRRSGSNEPTAAASPSQPERRPAFVLAASLCV
jgi:hypothetical protein